MLFLLFLGSPAHAQSEDECKGALVSKGLCEIKDELGDAAKAPFQAAGESALNAIASAIADAAVTIIGKVVGFFHETASVDLTQSWFADSYNFMAGVGLLLVLPMLIMATIRAVVRQDMGQLLRSVFLYLPLSIVATFLAIWLTSQLLVLTDHLTLAVSRGVGGDVRGFFKGGGGSVTAALTGTALAANPMLLVIFAGLIVLAGLAVWLELLVRSAAIYICVLFMPMVLAGLVWPATAKWCKRLAETLIALILSKFVIVAVISLATAAFSASVGAPDSVGTGEALGRVVGGGALFVMAAFAPFALFKLIPLAEHGAANAIDGLSRQPTQTLGPGGKTRSMYEMVKPRIQGAAAGGVAAAAGGATAGVASVVMSSQRQGTSTSSSSQREVAETAPVKPMAPSAPHRSARPDRGGDVGGAMTPPSTTGSKGEPGGRNG